MKNGLACMYMKELLLFATCIIVNQIFNVFLLSEYQNNGIQTFVQLVQYSSRIWESLADTWFRNLRVILKFQNRGPKVDYTNRFSDDKRTPNRDHCNYIVSSRRCDATNSEMPAKIKIGYLIWTLKMINDSNNEPSKPASRQSNPLKLS